MNLDKLGRSSRLVRSFLYGVALFGIAYFSTYLAFLYLYLGMAGWLTTVIVAVAVWGFFAITLSRFAEARSLFVGSLMSAIAILMFFQPTETFEDDVIIATHSRDIARCRKDLLVVPTPETSHQICLSNEQKSRSDAIAIIYDPSDIVQFLDDNYPQPRPGPTGSILKQWFDTPVSQGRDRIKFFAHCSVLAKGGNLFVVRLTNF